MAKHSPGPFKASKGTEDDDNRWLVLVDGPVPYLIAEIENGQPGDTLETDGATARLFAAAPDLLAACKALVTNHEVMMAAMKGAGHPYEADPEGPYMLAKAAVEKAEPGWTPDDDEEADTALYTETGTTDQE